MTGYTGRQDSGSGSGIAPLLKKDMELQVCSISGQEHIGPLLQAAIHAWCSRWPDTTPTSIPHLIVLALERLRVDKLTLAGMLDLKPHTIAYCGDGRVFRPASLIRLGELMEERGYERVAEYCFRQARERLAEINARGGRGREARR